MPSAPSSVPAPSPPVTKPSKLRQSGKRVGNAPLQYVIFAEFFAGDAGLTRVYKLAGIRCRSPDDIATGGVDFEIASQIHALREELRNLRTDEDVCLILHFAPPCSTFSRARGRSKRTRLRSTRRPGGLRGLRREQKADVKSANKIAKHTWEVACWAAKELKAIVTLESPRLSYIWAFFATLPGASAQIWQDVLVSQCRFGTTYRKDS